MSSKWKKRRLYDVICVCQCLRVVERSARARFIWRGASTEQVQVCIDSKVVFPHILPAHPRPSPPFASAVSRLNSSPRSYSSLCTTRLAPAPHLDLACCMHSAPSRTSFSGKKLASTIRSSKADPTRFAAGLLRPKTRPCP